MVAAHGARSGPGWGALALAVVLAGCAPRVHLTVLDAADVVVPGAVRTLAIEDRSGGEAGRVVEAIRGVVERSRRFAVVDSPSARPQDPPADAVVIVDRWAARSE
ncbi:MAG: hypothetical protein ABMB14_37925, partial [Myxococcota bacterium]